MKTVCIDARLWGVKNTGIGRYIECLIDNLPEDKNTRVVLIVTKESEKELKLQRFEKIVAKYHPYTNLAQFEMLGILTKLNPDLLHVPHFSVPVLWTGKMVVTIHDLIKHISRGPDTTTKNPIIYWIKYFQYLLIVWIAVKRAVRVIVPTKYWKDILVANYGLNSEKVVVTHEGVSPEFATTPGANIDLPEKTYVLYVGNVYPHKNIPTLLSAIKLLEGKVLSILVVGRSVFKERLEKHVDRMNLHKWVRILGPVSEKELITLYKHAEAFVFPSLVEGFGLPGLEAMALKTPVIAADSSCLPEVYGEAAIYFEPKNEKQLAEKIMDIVQDDKLRKNMIAKGLKQVKKYSWAKMAKQTWEIYQTVVN